jgi:hypothetical protein
LSMLPTFGKHVADALILTFFYIIE